MGEEGHGGPSEPDHGRGGLPATASDRLEAVQVVVLKKGSKAPGKNYKGVKQTYAKAFTTVV